MSVTVDPMILRVPATAEMTGLLDELCRFTYAANRHDLSDRLAQARSRVTDPTLRIVVTGQSAAGMSSLVDSLVGAPVTQVGAERGLPVMVSYANTGYNRLARTGSGLSQVEVGTPDPLLAQGVVLIDTPGTWGADSAAAATVLELVAGADAVLFVSDASQEYTSPEIEFLTQLHQLCPTVVGVITKIDLYPRWADIQNADRGHLDNAGLDIPLLPVSALLADAGRVEGDEMLAVESGVPQLVGFLRDRVVAEADTVARVSVVHDVRAVSDHLMTTLDAERDALIDPARSAELMARLSDAVAVAERMREQNASWQLLLGDGLTEVMAEVEHDLLHRLRGLVRAAEAEIMKSDPARRWEQFDGWLRERIAEAVQANFVLAHARANELAQRVAERFTAEGVVAIPELRLDHLGDALGSVQPLEDLASAKAAIVQRVISCIRGSYGGILMVGVLTSLAGLALVNPWSIGAGVLLGANTFWEDRKNLTARRQGEAKVAVARLMDDVIFQVGHESRYRLREVHRTLRDHFAAEAGEMLRTAEDALRGAQDAHQRHTYQCDATLAGVQTSLNELRQIRARATYLVR
jgi:ethanolamine utilization protein EutP (predicted NTPase)